MNTRIIIIFALLSLIGLRAVSIAQNVISDEERRQLEERFKELKTFYIADDGTVVFNHTAAEESEDGQATQAQQQGASKQQPARVKVKVNVNEDGEYVVTTEKEEDYSYIENESELYPVHESVLYTEEEKQDNNQSAVVGFATGEEIMRESSRSEKSVNASAKNEEKTTKVRAPKKNEPNLKSIEEATMVVEDILESLRKQQKQLNSQGRRGSMSDKIAGGVSSVRRDKYTHDLGYMQEDTTENNDVVEEGDGVPTYYINGVKSEEAEFKKLKTRDILKKERKISKSNPHGEWWVETRVQN